jgi:hypothetical protein
VVGRLGGGVACSRARCAGFGGEAAVVLAVDFGLFGCGDDKGMIDGHAAVFGGRGVDALGGK